LDPVLFRRFHADKFKAVPGKFAHLSEIFWRDKGAADKVKLIEVSNPFGVLFICFLALDGFDIFRVGKTDLNVIFEIIKNRNPIFASGFHTDMVTMILDEPVVKVLDIRVNSRKRFLEIFGYPVLVSSNDSSNDKIFVDIKTTADGVL